MSGSPFLVDLDRVRAANVLLGSAIACLRRRGLERICAEREAGHVTDDGRISLPTRSPVMEEVQCDARMICDCTVVAWRRQLADMGGGGLLRRGKRSEPSGLGRSMERAADCRRSHASRESSANGRLALGQAIETRASSCACAWSMLSPAAARKAFVRVGKGLAVPHVRHSAKPTASCEAKEALGASSGPSLPATSAY